MREFLDVLKRDSPSFLLGAVAGAFGLYITVLDTKHQLESFESLVTVQLENIIDRIEIGILPEARLRVSALEQTGKGTEKRLLVLEQFMTRGKRFTHEDSEKMRTAIIDELEALSDAAGTVASKISKVSNRVTRLEVIIDLPDKTIKDKK